MRICISFLLLCISFHSSSQKIYGVVYSDKGDILPYASVLIKGSSTGAMANQQGRFSVSLSPGNYTVVCQHVGFVTEEKHVVITSGEEELAFILNKQKFHFKKKAAKYGAEDLAYGMIRKAIKKRSYYNTEVKAYQCGLYMKDMIKLPGLLQTTLKDESDKDKIAMEESDNSIIYLSETVEKISAQSHHIKYEVEGNKVSGSGRFVNPFTTSINFYDNNIAIFSKRYNPRGFISPLADAAINFYLYVYEGSFWEDGKEINRIRVFPRRKYESSFSGIINIGESDARIHSVDLELFPRSGLELLDRLKIIQYHIPVGNGVWRLKNQLLNFDFTKLGNRTEGNFVSVYYNYNIHPVFAKYHFDNVLIKYDSGLHKRSALYWDTIRLIPLEKQEIKEVEFSDALYQQHTDTVLSKEVIDSLQKKQGPLKPLSVLLNGVNRVYYSQEHSFRWGIDPLLDKVEYNSAEGAVINLNGHYNRIYKKIRSSVFVDPSIRYGFSNTHLNVSATISFKTMDLYANEKLKRRIWSFSGGKRVSQFNKDSPISVDVNSVSTLFSGNNFMKTYENYFANVRFSKMYESGFSFGAGILYEDRMPLNNTTKFTLFPDDSIHIKPNYPHQKTSVQFMQHQAFIASIDISIQPGQQYIQYPGGKVSIGSKYPVFSVNYTKGIQGVLGSDVNFDKWKFTVLDDVDFRLGGLFKYKFTIGGFLNTDSVPIQDYLHFNGNQSFAAGEYLNSFQLAK
ncbi:MAG: carboxypeptidase-like regulatory domain-containing protein, partial [Sphingobacteriales bacterium]|nr:carboxypeptidase-like regulatory domain-containing protein [Sphingobacteriales bacterium]